MNPWCQGVASQHVWASPKQARGAVCKFPCISVLSYSQCCSVRYYEMIQDKARSPENRTKGHSFSLLRSVIPFVWSLASLPSLARSCPDFATTKTSNACEGQKKLGFRTELLVDVVRVTWRAKGVVMATNHLPVPLKNIGRRRTAQVIKPKDQINKTRAKLKLDCWSKQMQEASCCTFILKYYRLVFGHVHSTFFPPLYHNFGIDVDCGDRNGVDCFDGWWWRVSDADDFDYVDTLQRCWG